MSTGAYDEQMLKEFARIGITVGADGSTTIPRELMERARDAARERARMVAVPTTPSTPLYVHRDGMGLAVSRGSSRPALSLTSLRESRYRGLLFQPIHRARHYQMRRLAKPWYGDKTQVGLKVVHAGYHDRSQKPPPGFDKVIRQFESVLWNPEGPDGKVRTLGDALSLLWEDMATINRPVVEPIPSRIDPNSIVQWKVVDGALVWPTLLFEQHWWRHNGASIAARYRRPLTQEQRLQVISQILEIDVYGAEYVLVQEGLALNTYQRGQLVVAPVQNRTDVTFTGYPPSHVEEAIEFARAFADAFDFTAVQLSKGVFTQQIIGLPWDLSTDGFNAVVDLFRENAAGVRHAGQPLFMPKPPGEKEAVTVTPLVPALNEGGFQTFLSLVTALVATGIYRMHASTIGARPWDGGSGPTLSQGSETEAIGIAQEEGLQGDMEHLIDSVLNPLARRCHPDLRVIAWYGDFDSARAAEIHSARVQVDMTHNEARLENGLVPKGFWLSDEDLEKASDEDKAKHEANPYNHIAPIAMAMIAQQNQMATLDKQHSQQLEQIGRQQAGQEQEEGDPSESPSGGPDPFSAPMAKATTREIRVHVHDTEYP